MSNCNFNLLSQKEYVHHNIVLYVSSTRMVRHNFNIKRIVQNIIYKPV